MTTPTVTTADTVRELLTRHGWKGSVTGAGIFYPYYRYRRGGEVLTVKWGGTPERITIAHHDRPRRPGEVDDLPEGYDPRYAPDTVRTDLPRKGTTAAALEIITAGVLG